MGAQAAKLIQVATSNDMEALGRRVAATGPGAVRVYLQGDLGAGKTTWVRGFLRGMQYAGTVKSPTYTLVESYQVHGRAIHHLDLYRIHDAAELETIGIRDYLDGTGVCLVEWPEQGGGLLSEPDLLVQILIQGRGREVNLKSYTPAGTQLIRDL